ncbi:MAG: tol-pal system-associated acyl-CoA thioesterase [Alphaproteobacteria bacterium]|nr:tol-pal system-associated acyl-CoA thioesterase [Alphaproteobacteria bacterium]
MKTHKFECRIYYEDTDMAGIVYYANYLRYIERARSEQIRGLEIDQKVLKDEHGLVLVVRRVEADYLGAARLDDVIRVETTVRHVSGVQMTYQQDIYRGEVKLFGAVVKVACMNLAGRPSRLPADIRRAYHEIVA